MSSRAHWVTADRLAVGDAAFQVLPVNIFEPGRDKISMEGADFMVIKERPLVDRYVELVAELEPERVFELGIFQGGSTALLYELARPRRLVAIDMNPPNNPALTAYIEDRGLGDAVRIYDGIDQADRGRLRAIVADEFGDEPLDLVVDDCSHMYAPTRASFNEIFPRLRPGGVYVIEDWSWAHPQLDHEGDGLFPAEIPLTRLVFETLVALPSTPGLIASMTVDRCAVTLTRGDAELDPETFDIGDYVGPRGRELVDPGNGRQRAARRRFRPWR